MKKQRFKYRFFQKKVPEHFPRFSLCFLFVAVFQLASILFPTCHSCFSALPNLRLSPSETILKLLDVTLPADHVLKNILLMAGTSGVLSLQVLKEIRHWVCQSTLRVTDFKPVTRWSLGKFHDKRFRENLERTFWNHHNHEQPSQQNSFRSPSLPSSFGWSRTWNVSHTFHIHRVFCWVKTFSGPLARPERPCMNNGYKGCGCT